MSNINPTKVTQLRSEPQSSHEIFLAHLAEAKSAAGLMKRGFHPSADQFTSMVVILEHAFGEIEQTQRFNEDLSAIKPALDPHSVTAEGMSARATIAMHIMSGMQPYVQEQGLGANRAAECAVIQADELIAALNK